MIDSIESNGGYAACYTHAGDGVNYARWAVSAHPLSDRTKNFSVDSDGVVVWDTVNTPSSGTITWTTAANPANTSSCAYAGKKLPTMEMLKSLDLAQLKHGVRSAPAYGFTGSHYWSSTVYPALAAHSFHVPLHLGSIFSNPQSGSRYVRCVS